MKDAGIGGVEINPIKFPDQTVHLGIEALRWLSDDWFEMLQIALEGAKERGMTCDMIVGSGWPFGGEFLNREEQTQMVALGTCTLDGNQKYEITKEELFEDVDPEIPPPLLRQIEGVKRYRVSTRFYISKRRCS